MGNFNRDKFGSRGGRPSFGGGRGGFGGGKKFGRGFGGRDGGDRPMFKATCSDCGNSCEVPFKPFEGKPVYCNNCFKKDGDKGGSDKFSNRDFGRSDYEEKRMYEAVCDSCGNECEVPFRPTNGKPVYCSDCFGKGGGSEGPRNKGGQGGNSGDQYKAQFEALNAKLDRILKILPYIGSVTGAPKDGADEAKKESKEQSEQEIEKPSKKKASKENKKVEAKTEKLVDDEKKPQKSAKKADKKKK